MLRGFPLADSNIISRPLKEREGRTDRPIATGRAGERRGLKIPLLLCVSPRTQVTIDFVLHNQPPRLQVSSRFPMESAGRPGPAPFVAWLEQLTQPMAVMTYLDGIVLVTAAAVGIILKLLVYCR